MPVPPLCVSCRQRPAESQWRPFCSERCKMVDLGRWLAGDYRIPGPPIGPDDRTDEFGDGDDYPDLHTRR
jgi:endogenous inhibitor of DNA gyrase (YacG/DUF329 family)